MINSLPSGMTAVAGIEFFVDVECVCEVGPVVVGENGFLVVALVALERVRGLSVEVGLDLV
jgi:hypothetical protein